MARSREPTKENAKKLYEEGFGSLSQIAKELNLSLNTLMNHSVRENWMSKQKDYLERLYGRLRDERGQEHIQRRLESIDFLNWIQKKSMNLGTSLSPIA